MMGMSIPAIAREYEQALKAAVDQFEKDVNNEHVNEAMSNLNKAAIVAMARLQMQMAGVDPDQREPEPIDPNEITGLPVMPSGWGPHT